MKIVFKWILISLITLSSSFVLPHAEKDKARFVAATGIDKGFCDNPLRPCKSIVYAVGKASKGDKVLVASGTYSVSSQQELFYLQSEIVPILAGFNRFDHFQSQSPQTNVTTLIGVPENMIESMRQKGFHIINDGKATFADEIHRKKIQAFESLQKMQTNVDCISGNAGSFPCDSIDLLAHMPLGEFSSNPSTANDIWGHVDLNTGKEYAIIGLRNGTAVIDVSEPESPTEVGLISGSPSTWRDVKVYQYYDASLAVWKAFAYVTVDQAAEGVTIIDLNNLPNGISLVERNTSVSTAHNVYISNVDYSLNIKQDKVEPSLQLIGTDRFGGSFHSYSLATPNTLVRESNQSSFGGYTHDGASVLIEDNRKTSGCYNATENCVVFVDYNAKEMNLWDITNPADTRQLSSVTYNDVSNANKYVHSGWVSDDKRYVFLHDEFDENRGGLNSTVRIFQIDDLRAPIQVGQWTGPTNAIDHNGFVRGNRYYMSNYERGLTILDITSPSNPVEVGFFDTFPVSNGASFNGAWGVYPFLPSGILLVSDINSGLYILRDKTLTNPQGTVSFNSSEITTIQDSTLTIDVIRTGASASATTATVKYELISGSAIVEEDFGDVSGTLTWTANDQSAKQISINIAQQNDPNEVEEEFFVRLYDPRSGLTLTSPSYLTVKIAGAPKVGAIEFTTSSTNVAENIESVLITVNRSGGSDGEASVNYETVALDAESNIDFVSASGVLTWMDGDESSREITINIIDDDLEESDEVFNLILNNVAGANLGSQTELAITINDNESNGAPTISPIENLEVAARQLVSITANATDPEQEQLSYLWEQVSGENVSLIGANTPTLEFIAPNDNASIELQLTVTDSRGATDTATVTISVKVPTSNQPNDGDNSGGGSFGLVSILLLLFRSKKEYRAK